MGKENRMLVVCEKPSVARALGNAMNCKKNGKGYIEGKDQVITWCLGHLVETAQAAAYGDEYIKWCYESLPIIPEKWKYEIRNETKNQFKVIRELMKNNNFQFVVNACDAGREGELIFRLVYEKAGCRLPVKRLWISSMEEAVIRTGFEKLREGSEFDNLYQSALARQRADWLVGINGTRLFSVLYGHKVHKVGRVQSPTLAMVAERERQIMEFRKKPFYTVKLETDGLEAVSERFDQQEAARKLAAECNGATIKVLKVDREDKVTPPPRLFDLTALQKEANKLFGFTAKETLDHVQSLYEQKLCTYPRTDSRFLTEDMEDTALKVIEEVREKYYPDPKIKWETPDIKAILDSSKVSDHHAIIPTLSIRKADPGELAEGEQKILALISTGLLCAVGTPETHTAVKAVLECSNTIFTSSKKLSKNSGWRDLYDEMKRQYGASSEPAATPKEEAEESCFSSLVEGMHFIVRARVAEGFTKPPVRYTEAALLSAMEHAGATEYAETAEHAGVMEHVAAIKHTGATKHESTGHAGAAEHVDTAVRPDESVTKGGDDPEGKMQPCDTAGVNESGGADSPGGRKKSNTFARCGLGTPATRADIIEKLVLDKLLRREKKSLIPTDAGIELVTILPDELKSPKLTSDWENSLDQISRGEMEAEDFLKGIESMLRELVGRYQGIRENTGAKHS